MGSCSKDPSINRGPDFAESGPNGPKRTWERLKTVSPKNSENGGTGGALRPQNPTEGKHGSALTFAQAKTSRNGRRRERRRSDRRRLLDTQWKKKVLRPLHVSSSRANATGS